MISFQQGFEGSGFALVANRTGEAVHRQALGTLLKRGSVVVTSYDFCGEPLEFGAAPE